MKKIFEAEIEKKKADKNGDEKLLELERCFYKILIKLNDGV